MDNVVLAATIGGVSTASAAIVSALITRRKQLSGNDSAPLKYKHNETLTNIAHSMRDYTRTQQMLEAILSNYQHTDKIPDLYITNFGTPLTALRKCKGYTDYHSFLVNLTQNGKCIIHRYFVVTEEPILRQHIKKITTLCTGHSDANIYCCDNTPFGALGEATVNFLAIRGSFGAVTFETRAKIILSLHTHDPNEVSALIEVIRSIEPYCKRILVSGQKRDNL